MSYFTASRLHLLSLFLLFTLITVTLCQTTIYIDASNKNRYKDGTQSNPYSNFASAYSTISSVLSSGSAVIDITIFVKFNVNPYNVPTSIFTGSSSSTVIAINITNWDTFTAPRYPAACDNLPELDFDDGGWSFSDFSLVTINGLLLSSSGNAVNVSQTRAAFQLINSCILSGDGATSKSFFNISNTPNLMMNTVVIMSDSGTPIIDFENYKTDNQAQRLYMKDIVLTYMWNSDCPASPSSMIYLYSRKPNTANTVASITNVTFGDKNPNDIKAGVLRICSPAIRVIGFQNLTVSGLQMSQQKFTPITTFAQLIYTKNVDLVSLKGMNLTNNTFAVDVDASTTLKILNSNKFEMSDLAFEKNLVQATNQGGYQFVHTLDVNTTVYKDHWISENSMPGYFVFLNHTYDYNYDLSDGSTINGLTSYEVSNISLRYNDLGGSESNATYFNYIKADPTIVKTFNFTDFLYTKNNLTGRIIEIDLVGEPRVSNPTIMYFKDVAIVENDIVDTTFMEVYTENSPNIPQDEEPSFEFYTVAMNNLTIANNTFNRGVNVNWMYTVSIINCIGVQVFTNASTIANNTFNYYNFILLDQQLTSVFFLNSLVQNNTLTNSQFIVTDYQELPVLGGKFMDATNDAVKAIYRFTIIRGCKFLDLKISNQTFFMTNNGYLIIFGNHFTNITQDNKPFLQGGAFTPIALNMMSRYDRDIEVERATFYVDLNLWGLFNTTFDRIQDATDFVSINVIYYYLVANNTFDDINCQAETFITLNGYNFKQSVIYLRANRFLNFVMGTQTSMIQVIKCNAFEYRNNYIANITGYGSILNLRKLDQMWYCSVRSNTVTQLSGTGIISAEGDSINTLVIENNMFTSNVFLNNGIDISVVLNNGKITYFNNTFSDNILKLTNETLYHNYNLLSISAKLATGSQNTLFDSSVFSNNSVISTPGATQYGYSYGFLSFQIANSSIAFHNVTFKDNSLTDNNLKALFFIGDTVSISACNFTNNTKNSTEGFIFLYSSNISITDSYFGDLNDTHGKGAIDIATPAYLKYLCKVVITNNTFEKITALSGSVLTASGILDMVFDSNSIVDSFPTAGTIVMASSTCKPFCNFTNVSFKTTAETGYSGAFLFSFVKLEGKSLIQHLNMNYPQTTSLDIESVQSSGEIVTMLESKEGTVILDGIALHENSNGVYLGLISYNSGSVEIINSNFTNLRLIGVNLIEQIYVQQSFSLKMNNVKLTDITFVQKDRYTRDFGPLTIVDNADLTVATVYGKVDIENCAFERITYASGIRFQAPYIYEININQSKFNDLRYETGAAIACLDGIQKASTLVISNTHFENNHADAFGGAIVVSEMNYTITNCEFIKNSASMTGGAIYILNNEVTAGLNTSNTFVDNYAVYYYDIASSPNSIIVNISTPGSFYTQEIADTKKTYQYIITNMSSSALLSSNISVIVVDKDKKPAYDFSTNRFAVLKFGNQTLNITKCDVTECVIQNKTISLPGNAGDIIPLKVQYNSEFNIPAALIGIQIRDCIPGEYRNNVTNSCQRCPVNTYSLAPNVPCQYCPTDLATCAGGAAMCPLEGYWRAEGNFTQIYQCRTDSTKRCLGDCQGCEVGYTGPLCGACDFDKGYVEDDLFGCVKCDNPKLSLAISAATNVGYFLFTLFLTYQSYKNNVSFTEEENTMAEATKVKNAFYLRLISRFMQNFLSIFAYSVGFRQIYETITHGNTSYRFSYSTPQCTYMALSIDPSQFLYVNVMIDALEPFIQVFGFIIMIPILRKLHSNFSARIFLMSGLIYCGILHQSKIIGSLSSYLTCELPYTNAPAQRVIHHPNWTCDDPDYLKFTYYFVYPALGFWGLIVPVTFVTLVFKYGKKKVRQGMGIAMEGLFRPLKDKFYYWSVIVFFTQAALALCANKFALDYRTRVFVELGLIWVYETVIRWYEPYKLLNHLETATLNVLLLDILVSYYMLNDSYNILKPESVGLMVFVNFVVILYLAWQLVHMLDFGYFKRKRQMAHLLESSPKNNNSTLSLSLNKSALSEKQESFIG